LHVGCTSQYKTNRQLRTRKTFPIADVGYYVLIFHEAGRGKEGAPSPTSDRVEREEKSLILQLVGAKRKTVRCSKRWN